MNLNFSKNNHMRMGYNGQWDSQRVRPDQSWAIQYGSVVDFPGTFQRECLRAAQEIRDNFSGPIFIGCSGGVDSEVVAESFLMAKIPFTALIARFPEDSNSHDISYALKYCERKKIPYRFCEFDPLQFYKTTEFNDLVSKTFCLYPMLAVQAKILQFAVSLGGVCVMGGGDFALSGRQNEETMVIHKEISGSVLRIQSHLQIPGVYRFFRWSPELIGAFFFDPMIQSIFLDQTKDRDFNAEIKLQFYQKHFDVEARPKYYGWENFSEAEARVRAELLRKYPFAQNEIRTPFSIFCQRLVGSKLPKCDL